MIRKLTASALLAALASLALAQDIVHYNDRVTKKNNEKLVGTIEEESPSGIKIKVKDQVKLIPAADIVRVEYKPKGWAALDYRNPFGKEDRGRTSTGKTREKAYSEAMEGYTKLLPTMAEHLQARRYIEFRIADLTAVMAQDEPAKREEAIKLLTAFEASHPTAWTIVPALKTLARLLEDASRGDEARKAYEKLAAIPDVPADLKQESEILVGRLLLRGGRFADAETRLAKLATKMSAGDAFKPFVDAYLVEARIGQDKLDGAKKQLDAVIKGTSDPKLRSVAYNLLGDLHRKSGRLDDAFWAYLRVDAMFPEEIEEQAKALYYLGELFDRVKKDPARAKECHRRLREPRFAGTTFQKLLSPEKDEGK